MGDCKNRVRELFKSLYWSPIVNTFCQHRQLPLLILCVSYLCFFPSLLSRLDAGTGATWTTLRSALTLTGFMKVNRQGALNAVLTLVQIYATKWACVVPQGWPGVSQGHCFYFFCDQGEAWDCIVCTISLTTISWSHNHFTKLNFDCLPTLLTLLDLLLMMLMMDDDGWWWRWRWRWWQWHIRSYIGSPYRWTCEPCEQTGPSAALEVRWWWPWWI